MLNLAGVRVLHVVTRHIQGGGAERNLVHFIEWQQRQGMEVHVAVGAESVVSDFPLETPVHVIPSFGRSIHPWKDITSMRAVENLIAQHAFDVVHTHESKAGIIGRLAARNRVPAIVHSVHISSFGPSFHWPVSRAFLMAEHMCARYTDFFITVGTELRDTYVAAGLGRHEAYTVARSPVNVEAFFEVRGWNQERRRRARAELDLPAEGDLIIAVGNLEKRKRQHLLIRALARTLTNRNAYLVFAGGGKERESLEALSHEVGVSERVRFLGHVPRVERLFGAARMLVHASTREGVPQVVVQALAAGLPVVATDVEGLREIPSAPVDIAPRSGTGLPTRVSRTLDTPRFEQLPFGAFESWSEPHIEAQIERFHTRLADWLRVPEPMVRPA